MQNCSLHLYSFSISKVKTVYSVHFIYFFWNCSWGVYLLYFQELFITKRYIDIFTTYSLVEKIIVFSIHNYWRNVKWLVQTFWEIYPCCYIYVFIYKKVNKWSVHGVSVSSIQCINSLLFVHIVIFILLIFITEHVSLPEVAVVWLLQSYVTKSGHCNCCWQSHSASSSLARGFNYKYQLCSSTRVQ